MSQKLILHVGTHKTGTTAIQVTLARNRKALKDAGYVFPRLRPHFQRTRLSRNAHFANVAVSKTCGVEQLVPPDDTTLECVRACEKAFSPLADAEGSIILSDEWLWRDASMCERYWSELRSYFEGFGFSEFTIVAYLRRQDKFAEALWNQRVKTPVGFSMPLQEYLADERTLAICDYRSGVEKLASAFGEENLIVRRFERNSFIGGDVVPDFLAAIGVDPHIITRAVRNDPNTRLSNDAVEVKRKLNGNKAIACTDYSTFDIANSITEIMRTVTDEQPETLKTSILSQAEREEFLAQFADGNEWIAREVLGIEDGQLFGPERSDSYPLWNPDGASMRQATERTLELLAESYVSTAVEAQTLRQERAQLKKRIEKLESSRLYRLEKMLAAVPRAMKGNRK